MPPGPWEWYGRQEGVLGREQNSAPGWHLTIYRANSHALWGDSGVGSGPSAWAVGLPGSGVLLLLLRMGAACLWVPLPLSFLFPTFPTWGDRFSFSLVMVTLLWATGEQIPSGAWPALH